MWLNLFCHLPRLGYKNFASDDQSVNVWWVGLLACGEGWHNNHHVHPGSARMGMSKWEFDITWLIIRLLSALGLASQVNDGRAAVAAIANKSANVEKELTRVG